MFLESLYSDQSVSCCLTQNWRAGCIPGISNLCDFFAEQHSSSLYLWMAALQSLVHEGATVSGEEAIMAKLTSLADLHKAFGMQYKVAHHRCSWIQKVCWPACSTSCTASR